LDFTTATLDPRVTFTRSDNTATVINSAGTIVSVNADTPRFNFNPSTLVCNGLLIEQQRTNLLLNSLIDGTSLGTQSVTVTAVEHTLSFYGTGTVVLSGVHSATVNGSGAYPTRTTLTFTPSAGSLTLTVTGTVQFANLEVGSFATSFVPTDGTTKTRENDIATMTGTNFSSWYNATEGTFAVVSDANAPIPGTVARRYIEVTEGAASTNQFDLEYRTLTQVRCAINSGGASQALLTATRTATGLNTIVGAYKVDNFALACNGAAVSLDTSGLLPVNQDTLRIGSRFDVAGTACVNGTIAKIMYWPQRLTDNEVQAFSKG
jgi:hypothetical protein